MNNNDLTEGSVLKSLLRFFFPILLGMLFQQLYNTVDAIVVGRVVGHEALAAVGGSPAVIINLVIGVFTGLASGATVIISQFFGSRDDERLSRAAHTILAFCLLAGVAVTVLGSASALWSLRLVKTPEDILDLSARYLRIYYVGAAPLLLFNVASGILRAVGDSRRPLLYLAVCCCVNIVLDLLFVALLFCSGLYFLTRPRAAAAPQAQTQPQAQPTRSAAPKRVRSAAAWAHLSIIRSGIVFQLACPLSIDVNERSA